jgi:hypothetical protein
MIRGSFRYQDGQLVPATKEAPRNKSSLVGDEIVQGIEHPATGEVIYSKTQYKRITKAHGLEEAYGEPEKYFRKPDDSAEREADLEEDVLEALAKLNYGEAMSEEDLELCRQKNQALEWEQE